MCGRFTLALPAETLREFLQLAQAPNLSPRYNIAPTQPVAVARFDEGRDERVLDMLRWGLIPSWATDPAIGARMINARAESVAVKPAFRQAFRQRRCLVPADGFYEWNTTGTGKQPYHIRRSDGGPFAMAGLWERWRDELGGAVESCTLITTDANDLVRPIHNRMPVILPREAFGLWLEPGRADARQLLGLLTPYAGDDLVAVPVSRRVNRPDLDDPSLTAAIEL
jgi:putative SOS response-associated peptidase YedK